MMATPDLTRIEVDPEIMVGKPVVKDTRIPVSVILNLLARDYSVERIVEEYEALTADDVRAALYYASLQLERQEATPAIAGR